MALTSVVVRDKGAARLVAAIYGLHSPKIDVGVLAREGSAAKKTHDGQASDLTVLDVATFHEFGLGNNPERSFLRAYVDENRARLLKMLTVMLTAVIAGKYGRGQALEIIGVKMVGEIQLRIANRIPPALKQATIDRKGSDVPLIDTGQLRSSITYRVVLK